MKLITIKLTKASPKAGPFNIKDQFGNIISSGVSKDVLIMGISYSVDDDVDMITLESAGKCSSVKTKNITSIHIVEYANTEFVQTRTACLWRHLTDITKYNYFYGNVEPYVIEYPFSYQYQDEILQSVQDYTKVFKYESESTGVFTNVNKIETDTDWFNKAVVYNGQQSSGILNLVAKPINNLQAYMRYPILRTDSKDILFTKSDNFYQFNTFWSIVKDRTLPLFTTSCESLSIDKVVNQANMIYSQKSFNKYTIRAKDLKVRYYLDNRSDIHLVSQFIVTPSQLSYK